MLKAKWISKVKKSKAQRVTHSKTSNKQDDI